MKTKSSTQSTNSKPSPTFEKITTEAGRENFLPEATIEADKVIPTRTKKSSNKAIVTEIETPAKKVKKAKIKKEIGKRGRKTNPNSAHQQKLAARKAAEENGEVVKRGRKSNPNSANALRKARLEEMRKNGVEVKRGRPSSGKVKVAKTAKRKAAPVKAAVRIKLTNENSVRVQGQTYLTMIKAEKLGAQAQELCDFKSTLNHPRLGKMVKWNG